MLCVSFIILSQDNARAKIQIRNRLYMRRRLKWINVYHACSACSLFSVDWLAHIQSLFCKKKETQYINDAASKQKQHTPGHTQNNI